MRRYFILLLIFLSSIAYSQNHKTDSIEKRVNELEKRIIRTEALQESTKNSVTETKDVFLIFTIIFTVLTATFGIIQFFKSQRESKTNLEKAKITENKYNELLDKSKENIEQVTSLISSIESIFVISDKTTKLQNEIDKQKNEFEKRNNERDELRNKKIIEINSDAMRICKNLNRDNYKETKNRNIIREFCQNLNSAIQDFNFDSDKEINSNCSLLICLDSILNLLFEKAILSINEAIRKSQLYTTESTSEFLFPGLNSTEIKIWNKKLANICLFHKAIIMYNFGDYKEAELLFQQAAEYDPRDVKSMLYVPEAKFLGKLDTLNNIEEHFERLILKINEMDNTTGWRQNKQQLLSELFLKYGNCYFRTKSGKLVDAQYLKKAGEKFRKAYELNQESYITQFSLAQALSKKEKRDITEKDRKEMSDLFSQVYRKVRIKIGETNEAKILIMLYYILAICAKALNIDFRQYLLNIYEKGGQLPSLNNGEKKIRIYSPYTKNDLTYDELKIELEAFENN